MRRLFAAFICVSLSFCATAQYRLDSLEKVITEKEIDPVLNSEKDKGYSLKQEPDWRKIQKAIQRKYGRGRAAKIVLFGKIRWYESVKDWNSYGRSVLDRVQRYGPYFKMFPDDPAELDWRLNAVAWDLFEHCNDSLILSQALELSKQSMKLVSRTDGQYEDTYANLLYKLGRVSEAIAWEEKATAMERTRDSVSSPLLDTYRKTLEKMRSGVPTW